MLKRADICADTDGVYVDGVSIVFVAISHYALIDIELSLER